MFSMEKRIRSSITTEEQEAYRDGVPILRNQIKRRFILELQSIWSTVWCTAWKISTSSSSCTRTKCSSAAEMSSESWCAVWRNGHHVIVLLLPAFFSYPTIVYFKPVSPIPSSPCTTCGRRGASKEKKSVGSWFVAESAPLGGDL